MANNNTLEKIQTQLNQLATTFPALHQNEQWTEVVRELEHLSQDVNRQELLLETATAISDAASSTQDVDELLNVSVNLIKNSFDFYYVGIFLIDESNRWAELIAGTGEAGNSKLQQKDWLEIGEDSTVGRSISQQEPCISLDVGPDAVRFEDADLPHTRSEMVSPLISRGRVIGALTIHSTEQAAFSGEDVRLFQPLADQLANTIENAKLLTNADHQLQQLVTLHNISLEIGSQLDLDTLLHEVAQLSTKLLNADSCLVRLIDEREGTLNIKAVYNPAISLSQIEKLEADLSDQVAQTGQAILANDWPNHPLAAAYPNHMDGANRILAILNVPIATRKTVIGTIEVHSFTKVQAFDENDRYVLSLLASQAATTIENTGLLNQAENNRRFLKTVIEHIPDPIFIKDKDHTWLEMNQANANVLGYPEPELIGKTDLDYFPPELASEFYRRDNEVLTANQILEYEDKTVWADGQEHTAYTRLIPIPDPSGQPEYMLGISHDITERKVHEAERERFLAETAALYKGSRTLASALSERQVFETLFEQIRLESPCEISVFRFELVNDEPIWAELKANWQKQDNHTYPVGTRFHLPETLQARLLTTSEPLFIEDVATDRKLSDAERESFAPTAARSVAILPLSLSGQEIGSVLIYFTTPYTFSQVTQRFWLALIEQAGVALRNQQLIQEATYRVVQMETAAEVAREASSILDLDELLNSTVALIQDRFDLYYAGAFLVDEANEWAELRAGTGEAGRIQLEKKHRLRIGGESMIGWSVAHKQPRIALDVGKDAVHFQNPHLPETRSEMALPLIHHNKVIGALTIQSTEQAAFSREDIIFLQTMADQLANAIENARLYEQAQQEIVERKRVEEDLRTNELKYRELVENANSIIFRMDTQGRVTFFNEFAQQFFGYTEEEILGQNVVGKIVPETESSGRNLAEMIKDIIHHPEQYANNENENIRRNGERVWIFWTNKAIFDDKGRMTEILCIGNDATERKQTEEALRESEHRLKTVLDSMQAGIVTIEAETFQIVDANPAALRMINAERDEVIGALCHKFICPAEEGHCPVCHLGQRVDNSERVLLTAQGEEVPIIKNVVPATLGGRKYLIESFVSIAERKQAEEALRNSEALYSSLVENLPQNIFRKDLEGRFTFANQQYCATENKTLDEIIGKTDYDLFPLELAEKYRKDDEQVIETGEIFQTVEEHQPLGGDKIYVRVIKTPIYDSNKQIVGTQCMFWDITERKQAEESLARHAAELEEARNFLDSIIENIPMMIFVKDAEDLRFVRFNKAGEELIGVDREEMIGKNDYDFFPKDEADFFTAKDRQVLGQGHLTDIAEEPIQTVKKGVRLLHTRKVPILSADGKPKYLLGISGDITERKQTEQEILQRNEELAALNHVTTSITSTLDLEAILKATAREMVQIFNVRNCGIALLNPDRTELTIVADHSTRPDEPSAEGLVIPVVGNPSSAQVIETGQSIVITQAQTNPLTESIHDVMRQRRTQGMMMVPLRVRGEVIGTIGMDTVEIDREFTPGEVRLVETIAGQIAGAIENARLFEQTQAALAEREQAQQALANRERYLAAQIEIQNQLLAAKGHEPPYAETLELLGQASGASRVYVFENHRDASNRLLMSQRSEWCAEGIQPEIDNPALQNLPYDESFSRWAKILAQGESIAGRVTEFPKSERTILEPQGILAILILPLIVGDEFFGFIGFDNCIEARSWDSSEVGLLGSAAAAVSLWHERRRAEEGLWEALARTESLYRIGDAMTTVTDQQTTFETVLGEYLRLLRLQPAQGSLIFFEHAKGYSKIPVSYIDGEAVAPDLTISSEQNLLDQHLLEHSKPLVIEEVHTHPLTKDSPEIWQQFDSAAAMLVIPMIMRGAAIGATIAISTEKGGNFSHSDIEMGQAVTDQLAIWLENRQLLAEAQYRSDRLQTAAEVSRAASSILDVDELINNSVNLIRDQFDFYYVGLFLIDMAREWAVLRAGTGEAGRIQLEKNHRLKIGGESMIGWSVQNREARIALDVGEEAVHFQNPILPDTHSEMALPLISRDEVIGALTVQSVERGAFSDEDITLLQTMADQLANAIANARLYEASQRAARREALIKEITTKVRASTDLDTILQTTIKEIGDAIGSKRAYIHLVPPEETNGNTKSNVDVEG